ncbi:hypothetical protein HUN03_00374 [Mycoplasmopsis anatis]|uniref:Protein export membrane protein SecD/SecF C-terminal domain-containing protein n=1 Tax=Mycoplasmopsis anatis TaxID=171279 RepID=A0A9Q3L8S2_9BACT|nr:hypothetical protein [Mycoplasmopsis anatis]MBW0594520.1 hypothetical protein [Mycoplasmopsis anatis]MBW0595295.1 hypothetical protein [Mycoplasmopsis anatis]MBW0596131.1 hypothetical protein [Mycoplasmopsis anatis]MBW0596815.1 hypothetical protein [Mycoplasmopsis anatis]MBW0597766.1 hypothetical protein [Mycoplasmopsis anatis]
MNNKIKEFFKLNNWKRITLTILIFIASIATIIFGGVFLSTKGVRNSIEYGSGIQTIVKTEKEGNATTKEETNKIADSIHNRISSNQFSGISVVPNENGIITINQSGLFNDSLKEIYAKNIIEKPLITITDIDGKILFRDGLFSVNDNFNNNDPYRYTPPFQSQSAKADLTTNDNSHIILEYKNSESQLEFNKALQYIQSKKDPKILIWRNLDKLYELTKKYSADWEESGHNLYNFVHVGNKSTQEVLDSNSNSKVTKPSVLKSADFDAERFLIGVEEISYFSQYSSFTFKLLNNNYNYAISLRDDINYSLSDYKLELVSSSYIQNDHSNLPIIGFVVSIVLVVTFISILMIINYGILGAISTISLALYTAIVLMMFILLRGDYSPLLYLSMITGIIYVSNIHIQTFQKIKNNIYLGDSVKKAFRNANRDTLQHCADSNIIILIVSFILFYFGTANIREFSIPLIITIVAGLITSILITRITSSLLVSTGYFDNKQKYFGINLSKANAKLINDKVKSFNFIKSFKISSIIFAIVLLISVIVIITVGLVKQEFFLAFNTTSDFISGSTLIIQSDAINQNYITYNTAQKINEFILNSSDLPKVQDSLIMLTEKESLNYLIKINFENQFDISNLTNQLRVNFGMLKLDYFITNNTFNINIIKSTFISIGIILGITAFYTLIRTNWANLLTLLISISLVILSVIAITNLLHIQINNHILLLISVIFIISLITIFNNLINSNEIRNYLFTNKKVLTSKDLTQLYNTSVISFVKQNIKLFIIQLIASVIMFAVSFVGTINLWIPLVFLVSMIILNLIILFIIPGLQYFFNNIREKGIQRRINRRFWAINNPEEQTFNGVNDYTH